MVPNNSTLAIVTPPDETTQLGGGSDWISLRNFAAVIEKSYPTALKMAKQGKIAAIRVGGSWRVPKEEAIRFLKYGNHPDSEQH